MLLDSSESKGKLIGWLKELLLLREQRYEESRAKSLAVLVDFWGLTRDEAQLVYASLKNGMPEFERGTCRTCKGDGQVHRVVRSGCFGSEIDSGTCSKCNGTGIDDQRIKLPGQEGADDKAPDTDRGQNGEAGAPGAVLDVP